MRYICTWGGWRRDISVFFFFFESVMGIICKKARRLYAMYLDECGFVWFQSVKGLTDFPFVELNFNLYTDLNNFTLKSRIVAIVSNVKWAPRFARHHSKHRQIVHMANTKLSELKITKMRWYHNTKSSRERKKNARNWARVKNSFAVEKGSWWMRLNSLYWVGG